MDLLSLGGDAHDKIWVELDSKDPGGYVVGFEPSGRLFDIDRSVLFGRACDVSLTSCRSCGICPESLDIAFGCVSNVSWIGVGGMRKILTIGAANSSDTRLSEVSA
jgi:hypothetical protein